MLDDDRRSGDTVVRQQLAAKIARRVVRSTVVEDRLARIEDCVGRVGSAASGEFGQLQRVDLDGRHETQRNQFARLMSIYTHC